MLPNLSEQASTMNHDLFIKLIIDTCLFVCIFCWGAMPVWEMGKLNTFHDFLDGLHSYVLVPLAH